MTNLGVFILFSLVCFGYGSTLGGASRCEQATAGSDYISMINSHPNMSHHRTSVHYPNNYKKCWLIRGEMNGHVNVWSASFSLQPRDSSGQCRDWLKVYDGDHEDPDQLRSTYCGHQDIVSVTSTGNSLLMVFSTDSSVTDEGFMVEHHAVGWHQGPHGNRSHSYMATVGVAVVIAAVLFISVSLFAILFVLCKKYNQKKEERERRVMYGYENYPSVGDEPLPPKAP